MKFAGKRFQRKECAASVTVWIRQCAVSLFESFNGVAQPFEFVEGHLKFRVCHLVFLTPQEARPDLHRGRSVAWTLDSFTSPSYSKTESGVDVSHLGRLT